MLSGRIHRPQRSREAQAWGLADRVHAPEDLLPKALALAGEIAANPAPQLRMIKQLLSANGTATDLDEVQRRESVLLRECWKSPEHHEAVQAFLAKRPPRFRRES